MSLIYTCYYINHGIHSEIRQENGKNINKMNEMKLKKLFTSWSIRKKILLLLACFFLFSLSIAVLSGLNERKDEIENAQRHALLLVQSLAGTQEQIITGTRQMLSTLAQLPEVRQLDIEACNKLFRRIQQQNPHYTNISMASPDGILIASSVPFEPGTVNLADRRHFKEALRTLDFAAGEYIVGRVSKVQSINFTYPVMHENRELIAVVIAAYRLDEYSRYLDQMNLSDQSTVAIADYRGIRLFRWPENASAAAGFPIPQEILALANGASDEGLYERTGDDGVSRIYAFKRLKLREGALPYMYMFVGLGKAQILEKANFYLWAYLSLLVFSAILVSMLSWLLAEVTISRPIITLTAVARQLGKGDLSTRTGIPRSDDELGQLARAFDDMATLLETKEKERDESAEALIQAYKDMEFRIHERTAELSKVNADLLKEISERKSAENALRESEAFYRMTFNNVQDVIYIIDTNYMIQSVSPGVKNQLGYDPEELVNKPFDELNVITAESLQQAASDAVRVLAGEQINASIYEFIAKNGEHKFGEVNGTPLYRDGRIVGLISVARDITERKKVEDRLRESEQSFSQLFESAPVPMAFASDVDDYRATTWNEAWYQTFGYTREQAHGRSGNDIDLWVTPQDRTRFIDMANHMKTVADFQTLLRRNDGSVRICSLYGRFISKSGHNLLMVIYFDITDRKRIEEALTENEEKFRLTFSSSPDAVTISSIKDGRFLDVNDGFIKATGFTREEIIGKTSLELSIWANQADREKFILNLQKNRFVENLETQFRCKDGRRITALLSAKIIFLKGIAHLIMIARDISEFKALTSRLQQAERLEAIGSLASGVAHDFNNLLMGIQGRIALMSIGIPDSHPNLKHTLAIEEYIQSASNLTKQLLGLARGGKYEVAPVDMNEIVQQSAAMFGRIKKEIQMHTCFHKSPLVVEADKGQVEQVLLNMFINAWQAMPAGGGDIYIETKIADLNETICKPYQIVPGYYGAVSITDTGKGMDETTLRQVFDPFFTTKEKGRGTGLGLASAYGIIKNHGGAITVYSEIDHGTTFNIYIPLSGRRPNTEFHVPNEIMPGTETILLIDDEEMILQVEQAVVETLGYRTVIARSGEEALQTISEMGSRIDLVILDMVMPGMDGSACFDHIRRIMPELPVILSSGYAINGHAEKIMRMGCKGFIQKPYNVAELSQKVRKVLDESKKPIQEQ